MTLDELKRKHKLFFALGADDKGHQLVKEGDDLTLHIQTGHGTSPVYRVTESGFEFLRDEGENLMNKSLTWDQRVRALCEAMAVTHAEMAVLTDVTVTTISRWCNGKARPDRRSRKVLAALEEKTFGKDDFAV